MIRAPRRSRGARASYGEGAAFAALSFGQTVLISIASAIVISRLYGVQVVGEFALASAAANAVAILSSARERPAFVRRLAILPLREPRVAGLFLSMLAFSAGLTALIGILAVPILYVVLHGPVDAPQVFLPALVNVWCYVLFVNTAFNYDTLLAAFRAGRQLFWIRLHQSIAFFALAALFAIWERTVWALVLAMLVSSITSLVHRAISARAFMPYRGVGRAAIREGFETLPDTIRFGLKIAPGGLADGVSNEVGTWTIGVVGTLSEVGAYGRAWMIGRQLVAINWRITEMLFPTMVERRQRGDHAGFDRVLFDSLRYALNGMMLPAAAAGGAAVGVMRLFGPGFDQAAGALTIVLLTPALASVSNAMRHGLYANDRPVITSVSAAIRMLATVTATVILATAWGATGAAAGAVLGLLVDIAFMAWLLRSHVSSSLGELWPVRELATTGAAYAVGFISSRLVYDAAPNDAGLLAALIVGTATASAVFYLLGGVNDRDRARMARVLARVRGRTQQAASSRPAVDASPK